MNKKIFAVFFILLAAAIIMLPRARADGNSSANETEINETEINENLTNETLTNETQINETQTNETLLNETELNETEENETEENETEHEDNDDLNETEEEEIKPMRTPHGAEVRLLQLEKSITRNILVGNQTIAAIKAGNSSANTSALSGILSKLVVLRTEVQGIDLNGTHEELAQQFVDIKREAINLSKQFRDTARPLLKATDRKTIQEYMKQLDRSELRDINNEINDAKHKYNYALLNATFAHLGLNNSELLEAVRNGSAKVGEIKKYVRNSLTNETPKEMHNAMLKLREAETKKNVFVESVKERVAANKASRMSERLQNMSEKLKEMSGQLNEHKGNKRQE